MDGGSEHKRGVYFPGLNGLRFFAAFAVIITHVELLKKLMSRIYPFQQGWIDLWGVWITGPFEGKKVVDFFPLHSILTDDKVSWYHPIVSDAGPLGVTFFFVLSGFLITYLLFVERTKTGKIGVKQFYMRRILRIWPLYFFVVFLGFFVLPQFGYFYVPYQSFITEPHNSENFWGAFALFMLMLPNLAFAAYGPFPNIGQSWSIGVEEQFYLVWPWILKKAVNPLKSMLIFFFGFILIKAIVLIWSMYSSHESLSVIKVFFAMSKLECMAIGGIGAWLLFYQKNEILKWVYRPGAQLLSIIGLPFLLYFTPVIFEDVMHILYAVFFLIIILNVSTNKASIFKLEHPILHLLGKISYGIYMYHMMVIIVVLHVFTKIVPATTPQTWWMHGLIYLASVSITILVSYLSYKFLESRFIGIKARFAKVKSGDSVEKHDR